MYNGYSAYNPGSYQGQGYQYSRAQGQQEQAYPAFTGGMYQQASAQPQQGIKGRPVSSYDEAKASMIDLDGSLFVFPDVANKRIYTKQIMLDGSADFRVYVLQEQGSSDVKQEQEMEQGAYVLKKDFDKVVSDFKKQIKALKEGVKNVTTANENNE